MAAPADYVSGLLQPAAATAAAAGALQPTPVQQAGGGRAAHPLPAQMQQAQYQAAGQQQLAFSSGGVPLVAPACYTAGSAQRPPGGSVPQPMPPQAYAATQQLLLGVQSAGGAAAGGCDDVLYVNPRQLAGILRRRKQREAQQLKAKAHQLKASTVRGGRRE